MISVTPGAGNTISGGAQHTVLQGQNFRDTHIHNVIQAAAAPVALAQLPPLEPGFSGRDHELSLIIELLDPAVGPAAVVVSAVAGLAGVGKTALAVQAAHAARQNGWFPGGVLFVDLHGYDATPVTPAQALDALLRALGIPAEHIPPGTEERAALYRSALTAIPEAVLVVADNASSEAQVRPVLPGPGSHRVIATSRHTLAGLSARLLDITTLSTGAAVVLLEAALRAARPDDCRITSDQDGARRLAGACGGLPLALRITAALLAADPALTAGELAADLADETQRLEALAYDDGGGTSAPSVAAAFELSYRQLDEPAARLFRLIAICPGPDLSAGAATALADTPARGTRQTLSRLARAHLIEPAAGAAGRWRMHDLLRLYARQVSDAHAAADHRDHATGELLDYYARSTRAADARLRALPGTETPAGFASQDDALAWLDAERPCLIGAVTLAADTGRDQIAMTLPLELGEYLRWRRRFDDWISVLAVSRDTARRRDDKPHEAAALNSLGLALRQARRFDEAIIAHQDAVAVFRVTGDRYSQGDALTNLGLALQEVRRSDEAIAACQDAADIFRDSGDRHRNGMALASLGIALREVQRFDEAIAAFEQDLAICRETGDRNGEGRTLTNLGIALREMRRFDEAIAACQDAAAIFRDTGDLNGQGLALGNLGLALHEAGRFDEAITAHQEAGLICRETSNRHGEGMVLNKLGLALRAVRRRDEAIAAHQQAAALFRGTGDRHREASALNNLGLALQEVRRFDDAITAHQQAASIYRDTGDHEGEDMALDNLRAAGAAQAIAGTE